MPALSYRKKRSPLDFRREIEDACHDLTALHLLLKIADPVQLRRMGEEDIATLFTGIGNIALAAGDAILESLEQAAGGNGPRKKERSALNGACNPQPVVVYVRKTTKRVGNDPSPTRTRKRVRASRRAPG